MEQLARNSNISRYKLQQTLSKDDQINFGNTRIYYDYKVELIGVEQKSDKCGRNYCIIIALLHCLFFVCTSWAQRHMPTPITHLCFACALPSCVVRPSVRLSRSWIMSNRINISSKFFHHPIQPHHSSFFFHTKRGGDIPTETPLTGASNADGVQAEIAILV